MSDLLIKNMEIPKACFRGVEEHCPWFYKCRQLRDFCDKHCNEDIINNIYQGRLEDCPLVEVKPHGDLIDRDALKKHMTDLLRHDYVFDEVGCFGLVKIAPTVLEASHE